MHIAHTMARGTHRVLYTLLSLVCVLGSPWGALGTAAEVLGPCEPSLARSWGGGLPVILATTQSPQGAAGGPVLLEWLGHSSFVLTSPEGLRLLTDPNGFHPIPGTPDVVTVSNLHMTHSAVRQVPGAPQVLWGLTPDRGWNSLALTIHDLSLFNVPSYASRTAPEDSPIQNSIFVFRVGGLCIVHLGNLRHALTPLQLQRIGKPDVVMMPADGQWTLSFEDALTVINQLQPLLVIPMHLETPRHVEVFVQQVGGRYAARRLTGRTLTLSRSLLPHSTEIVVFGEGVMHR